MKGDRLAVEARNYLEARRRRQVIFGDGLFADPAWDILLDLYLRQDEGLETCVTSACLAGGVPPTTALASIVKLEARGLLTRERDHHDRRRVLVGLTPPAVEAVEEWLGGLAAGK